MFPSSRVRFVEARKFGGTSLRFSPLSVLAVTAIGVFCAAQLVVAGDGARNGHECCRGFEFADNKQYDG